MFIKVIFVSIIYRSMSSFIHDDFLLQTDFANVSITTLQKNYLL
ncbi:hypothetical protein JCM19296_1138 [Nonlabens ulvanivorans]|uniref:Uncharacterized protein n=1 Tax=Nonlabens ulvanivorans TaxID=906888 RepID=A0A081D9F0_NONUL|nr:hypothetical protein JCM19296_1138 [Nonlabens ulvanivorans]